MSRVSFAIIVFFSVAFALYWQSELKRGEEEGLIKQNNDQPDFVANNLRSTTFNAQGQIETQITANYMEHYQQGSLTQFLKPVFHLYPKANEEHWRVSAEVGKLQHNLVTLKDNVIIDALSTNEPIEQLETDFLSLNIDTMQMNSAAPITILGQGFSVDGIGLFADLNQEHIQLLQQVTATYEPN